MNEVMMIITACDRNDLLEKTLKSFVEFNTYPISGLVIRDDCGLPEVRNQMMEMIIRLNLPFPTKTLPLGQIGQGNSIDLLMKEVTTPYVFHCEDDWEFYKPGFIEKSFEILNHDEKIVQVWIRDPEDNTGTEYSDEVYYANEVPYRLVTKRQGVSGYTFNPHLKRMSDYTIPYMELVNSIPENPFGEDIIGKHYTDLGFSSAWLIEGYCRHLGWEKSTYRPGTPYREKAKKL